MNRREFLRYSMLGTGFALSGCRWHFPRRKPRVIVVGAGLSGLATAFELQKRGYDLLVLEGQSRVGGRVLTKREGYRDGQYAELGAAQILEAHSLVFAYAKELGLKLEKIEGLVLGESCYFRDKLFFDKDSARNKPPKEWKLHASEQALGLEAAFSRLYYQAIEPANQQDPEKWASSAQAAELDKITFSNLISKNGASPMLLDFARAKLGTFIDEESAAQLILQETLLREKFAPYRMEGGSDCLPAALAARLRGRIRLGLPVIEVRRSGNEWVLRHPAGEERAEKVIFTSSPYALRKINFTGCLSEAKRAAIEQAKMAPATVVNFGLKKRLWPGVPGEEVGLSDQTLEAIWDRSSGHGPSGVLTAYAHSANARTLDALPLKAALQRAKADAERILPGIGMQIYNQELFSWGKQDWIGGAWVNFKPGELSLQNRLAQAEPGGLHFAGDHTTSFYGWQEGALRSAKRVAFELDAAGK